jgi:hypothetical protein
MSSLLVSRTFAVKAIRRDPKNSTPLMAAKIDEVANPAMLSQNDTSARSMSHGASQQDCKHR